MSNGVLAFDDFRLDPAERRLTRGEEPVELSGRYLDALILLAANSGALVTKDRFMAEVWRGVPVTDEALTQCIRSLRRALGDDAARPRFIETVPRHGYRFLAAVERCGGTNTNPGRPSAGALPPSPDTAARPAESSATTGTPDPTRSSAPHNATSIPPPDPAASNIGQPPTEPNAANSTTRGGIGDLKGGSPFKSPDGLSMSTNALRSAGEVESGESRQVDRPESRPGGQAEGGGSALPNLVFAGPPGPLVLAAAGLAGGAAAGLVGGIGYGLLFAANPPPGTGAISIMLVITCLCLIVGLLGGLGVGAGIAAARLFPGRRLFPLMAGGALGGLLVGALGRLIGLDAFTLLVGSRPVAITGGSEGLLIGALASAAAWLALTRRDLAPERIAALGLAIGALAGLMVALGGGQMMAGSLAVLAAAHPQAPLGALLGTPSPAGWFRLASSALEGAIFVGALTLAFVVAARGSLHSGRAASR